jgi:hypothetical protein
MAGKQSEARFRLTLTHVQRKSIAAFAPELAGRVRLTEPNERIIEFSHAELKEIQAKAEAAIERAPNGTARRPLRYVLDAATRALEQSRGGGPIPASERVYQFKITLAESHPPIWRRIQVKDGTLDDLHEHIQTAMGWTNSHLHDFRIGEQLYGDPDLMQENFEEFDYKNSRTTRISTLVPRGGKPLRFGYQYDFGDSWQHEVLFEGIVPAEAKTKYPLCVDGARACPPEDCGGIGSYAYFLEAIQDPEHERHDELVQWVGGEFDPEAFDATKATREMRRGLPDDWRKELW